MTIHHQGPRQSRHGSPLRSRRHAPTVWPLCLGLAGAVFASSAVAQTQPRAVSMLEGSLRQAVATRVMPEYPAASLARRSEGVVVVRVRAGLDNRMERVDIVQSPDPDIAAAVRAAVTQWTVARRSETGGPVGNAAESRLTFYFQIRNGMGVVLNPDEMPGNESVFPPPVRTAARMGGPPTALRGPVAAAEEVDETALARSLAGGAVLLDVRDREPFAASARPDAINIPLEELMVRAGAELSRQSAVVIDCSRTETFRCHAGADALRRRGFEQVSIYLP
jgi:rhodanese-related sulfurtransferase